LGVFYDEDYIEKNVTKTFRKSKNVIRRKFPFKNVKGWRYDKFEKEK
jgi:hypothetical protein